MLDSIIAPHQADNYDAQEAASFEIHFEKAPGFYGIDAELFKARLHTYADDGMRWETAPLTTTTFDQLVEMTRQGQQQQVIAKTLNV